MTPKTIGRVVGLLIVLQLLAQPVVNFRLLRPAMSSAEGFLASAAPLAGQVRLGVLLGLVVAGLSVALATTAWPVWRNASRALAQWHLLLASVGLALAAVEGVMLLTMLSTSQAWVAADAGARGPIEAFAALLQPMRTWAHHYGLLFGGATNLAMFAAMFRGALVWRPFAAFGVAAALLQMVGAAMPLFGERTVLALMMPLGIALLGLVAWLLWRGFPERPSATAPAPGG
jgi:hypothetical protein